MRRRHAAAREALAIALLCLSVVAACRREEVYHDHPLPYWVEALHDPDPSVRARAADVFSEAAPRSMASVNTLLDALAAESNTSLHPIFAQALGRLGPAAAPAVPRLVVLLHDQHEEVRRAAATALGNVGSPALAVPALAQTLRDCCHEVRAAAAEALGRIGPGAADATPALVAALQNDPVSWVRLLSAQALLAIRPKPQQSIDGLTKALADQREEVRAVAATVLAQFGPAAAPALSGLRQLLADEDANVRRAAAQALGGIGAAASAALPDLRQAQRDSDVSVRAAARDAMLRIGATS